MVCAKCEAADRASKKGTGLAVTDVWKATGSGSEQRNDRKIGGNKLLEAKKRYSSSVPAAGSAAAKRVAAATAAIAADAAAKANAPGARPAAASPDAGDSSTGTEVGSSKRGASSTLALSSRVPGKCLVCKVTVAKDGAIFCQKCAYKQGKCAMCGDPVLDTKQYKMSTA